tara:strand:+ start:269 stop:802 length:534 start_codon:yes stop_codon:yes gene_type:complete
MKRFTKQDILSSVSILELAKHFSIPLEQVCSGNFTHKCRCPSPEHKSGSERTGSLYIDGENNNFYCFGCGASNNVIDFYILKTGCDFSTALSEMSEFVDPNKVSGKPSVVKKNNFASLLSISNMFRKVQLENPHDLEWIESVMIKTDYYIAEIDRYDVKKTKALETKVRRVLNRRFS